jgi:hypothetical protein
VLVEFSNWRRSALYVYDDEGTLRYQEILGEPCSALAAVPDKEAGAEVLLIGGDGKVWEYRLNP